MSERPVVLLTNPIHPDGEAILAPQVRLVTAPDTEPDTLRSYAKNAAGIIVRAKLPDDIFKHAPHVRVVVRHGVSLDLIPLAAAKRRKIIVANLPGLNTETVAEYFFSALFHLRRPLGELIPRSGPTAGRRRARLRRMPSRSVRRRSASSVSVKSASALCGSREASV